MRYEWTNKTVMKMNRARMEERGLERLKILRLISEYFPRTYKIDMNTNKMDANMVRARGMLKRVRGCAENCLSAAIGAEKGHLNAVLFEFIVLPIHVLSLGSQC